MKGKNFLILLIVLVVVLIIFMFSSGSGDESSSSEEEFVVATTFYPLYSLTESVVGGVGEVYSIVPAGVEPHSYEPSPGDVATLSNADVFVTLGVEFEKFEEDLAESTSAKIIAAGEGISLLEASHSEEEHDEHSEDENSHEEESHEEDEHGHHHDHGGQDPHIWLSPKNAQLMINNIVQGLSSTNSEFSDQFQSNGAELIRELEELDEEYEQGLGSCAKDTILVNHNAFSYLANDYGFTSVAVAGLEPEAEPTPGQLAELIEEAREHDLKYIFYEELVDPRVAQTIADEVGAEVLELSPVAGDFSVKYVDLMRRNLANLKIALEC